MFIPADENERIYSPHYPASYPNDITSTWTIRTEENWKVLLTFNTFDTEEGADFVRAWDGVDMSSDEDLLVEWSGVDPPDVLSTGNALFLSFASNSNVTDSGFSLLVHSVQLSGV